ncbi:MAG: ATP-binding protein [Nitriliruptoraceae bacterium]
MGATDRAELEQRLHELEELFRLAMTNAPIGMAISTLDGPWVAVNPALCALFGYTEEELLGGLSFADLTHPDDLPAELVLLDEMLAGARSTYALDKRYRCRDGSLVWTRTVVSLVRDRDGSPRYFVAQCLDATEQHLVEQELRHLAAELERTAADLRESDDIRVAFLRATSHELRTPLTVVAGLADTLRRHHTELAPEQITELLDRLRGQTERLTTVVSDLLDVDQLTTGLVRASRRPLPLAHVVRSVLEATAIPDRRIETDLTEVVVPGDLAKLERVVANLLANAVRHTRTGGWIGLWTTEVADQAELVVEDDGTGLPAGFETRIFEPFVQGPQHRHDARPGTGLGLTLVREYVALHGGSVHAENRTEGGARFVIRLPLDAPDTPRERASSAAGVDHG